ncbi:LuxR C-terminal-related transcriptional regulator [Nocardia sp. NPDC059091]|uniref:LuxR C-terminal-related transcriptional regulator n=1 Tax=Nocardia sp. NPDC059091 TaxID=3346724 RepID=UPI0036B1B24C
MLLPFEAFVTLGRRAAIGVAATILGVVATAVALHAHDRTGTARPAELVMFSIGGASNREIARALYVSEGTVKNHVSNILTRLGVRDRTQAAIYALDHDLA